MNAQEIADARLDANAAVKAFEDSRRIDSKPGCEAAQASWSVLRLALYLLQSLTALEEARRDLAVLEVLLGDKWEGVVGR